MKYVDEFRAPELIGKAGEEIRRLADPNGTIGSWKFAAAIRTRFIVSV